MGQSVGHRGTGNGASWGWIVSGARAGGFSWLSWSGVWPVVPVTKATTVVGVSDLKVAPAWNVQFQKFEFSEHQKTVGKTVQSTKLHDLIVFQVLRSRDM